MTTFAATPVAWARRFGTTLSVPGIVLGTAFLAASLAPSLVPRHFMLQGVLTGCSFAAGYGIGVFASWLWAYLELPRASPQLESASRRLALIVCGAICVLLLYLSSDWQDSVRTRMGLAPVESYHPLEVALIAIVVFGLLMLVGRLFGFVFARAARWFGRYVPRRVANVLGVVAALLIFWLATNDVFVRYALRAADQSARQFDALMEPQYAQPTDSAKVGSPASLVDWGDLGRAGREFVASGPTASNIGGFTGRETLEPLRVYVGLNSAETAEDRARLALEELKRVGGFERSVLVLITPTGTGWIDPEAMDTIEFLHDGDVASVAQQYSYLTSWLSLLVEPGYGAEAARALFAQVYGHWKTLPADDRPALYLYGLSLGALNSDLSVNMFEMVADPVQGILWSGPPFPSRTWNAVKRDRDRGTPAWLPRYGDGSAIRFTSQVNMLDGGHAPWGPMRIVYLQYASDPVVFFDPSALYRRPEWMIGERGPDVSPHFRWFPVVTLLQLGLDMALATTTPMGYGHIYAPEHYIDAWMAVTSPPGWPPEEIERLKAHFIARRQ